jgi:hypothetical protein
MALEILRTLECGNSWEHGTAHQPAVAFVRDQSFSRWWGARCAPCLDRLSRHDQPTRYEVVYLDHPTQPAVERSEADPATHHDALD